MTVEVEAVDAGSDIGEGGIEPVGSVRWGASEGSAVRDRVGSDGMNGEGRAW